MWQLKLNDPTVAAHLSGKEFARLMAEELGEPTLFAENVSVREQGETASAAHDTEADQMQQLQTKAQIGI